MFYDAVKNDHGFAVDPFKAIVVPRPIGWVSSLSPVSCAASPLAAWRRARWSGASCAPMGHR